MVVVGKGQKPAPGRGVQDARVFSLGQNSLSGGAFRIPIASAVRLSDRHHRGPIQPLDAPRLVVVIRDKHA